MNRVIASVALALLKAERARYAKHAEYVLSFRGTGYRPQFCIHGARLWVDHDIPCGRCEEGEGSWDYLRIAAECIDEAKRRHAEYKRRQDAWHAIYRIDVAAPGLAELVSWVSEPLRVEELV